MRVIVYSKRHCVECMALHDFLANHNIPYETRDCFREEKYAAEVRAMGFLGVPVTVMDGNPIRGFRPQALLAAWQQR